MQVSDAVGVLITSKGEPLTPSDQVLASLALDLARRLDDPAADDRHAAGLAKELRTTVAQLSGGADVDAFAELAARLSAPVGDATH